MSARRAGVANSGVPQKTIRTTLQVLVVRLAVLLGSGAHGANQIGIRAFELVPRRQRSLLFEDAQVIDEELPVQMVDLVLQTPREQLRGLDLERLTIAIERPHDDVRGSLDIPIHLGNRQTPFLGLRHATIGYEDL